MCVHNLKLVDLPVTEIIVVPQKFWAVPAYAHASFLNNFNGLSFGWTLWMYRPHLKSVALPVPEIIATKRLVGLANPQYGVGDGAVQKSVGKFLLALHSDFSSIFTRFRDIAAFVLQHATFPHPTSSLLKFPHVPLGVGGLTLGCEERSSWANCPCN